MSNFDKTVDLFSSPYLTILGNSAGRAPLELPDRKDNFKYTRQNLQKIDKDDEMHEDDINHITYFGAPVNVIDPNTYIALGYSGKPTGLPGEPGGPGSGGGGGQGGSGGGGGAGRKSNVI